jgi:hypothetical protein
MMGWQQNGMARLRPPRGRLRAATAELGKANAILSAPKPDWKFRE